MAVFYLAKKSNLDPVQEEVRSVFRKNRDVTRNCNRSKNILNHYDMEEPKYSRRMKAVVNLYQDLSTALQRSTRYPMWKRALHILPRCRFLLMIVWMMKHLFCWAQQYECSTT